MRVAVAHEWLTNWAGSERVARELVTVGGAAELVASVVDRSFTAEYFPDVDVRPLWTSHLPTATTRCGFTRSTAISYTSGASAIRASAEGEPVEGL